MNVTFQVLPAASWHKILLAHTRLAINNLFTWRVQIKQMEQATF